MASNLMKEHLNSRERLDGPNDDLEVIWGAQRIGMVLGVTSRQAFYLLERNMLKGAAKLGCRWCITLKALRANVEPPH